MTTPGVIIDGAVPRNTYERACEVYGYLLTLEGHTVGDWDEENNPEQLLSEWNANGECVSYDAEVWRVIEEDIIGKINEVLPDDYVCTLGEQQPGDVIVREIGNDERLDQEGV